VKKSYYLALLLLLAFSSCAKRTPPDAPTRSKGESSKHAQKGNESKAISDHSYRIVIDAGHGGTDPGAKSVVAPHTREKTFTLKTALKVQEFLVNWGYDTLMTRKNDVFVPLLDRVEFAEKNKGKLFVSIHFNSTPKPTTARGIEIYYFSENKKHHRTKLSSALAHHIIKRMVPVTKAPSRGVHAGNFCVIRETTMPAVLVEAGFLSNPEEAKKLKNPNYIRFLAWSIAKGIDDYVQERKG
jgi:N-acetylmuramoyl-L-alanine amidase